MLSTEQAIAGMVAAVAPVAGLETVSLFDALGRVLAEDVVARRTVPADNNSAVDGYAVRAADLVAPDVRLPIGGRIAAGHPFHRPIAPGEALRIFTGAPIPSGADTVLPQEICIVDGDFVRLPLVPEGANFRPAGEDFHAGAVVLPAGRRLLPQDMAQAAAAGHAALSVRRRPRVALFATGDEVREPGAELGAGCVINSNSYFLHGLLRHLGCDPVYLGIIPDCGDAVRTALAAAVAAGADALLTSGGVSMGEEDHVKGAIEALGSLEFWRIAIRPGRPLAFGRIGDVPFLGLPGNPVAAFVTFLVFARPLLLQLAGALPQPLCPVPVAADFSYKAKKAGRREWLRGTVGLEDGRLVAHRYPDQGSGIFSSVTDSDGLIDLATDLDGVSPGTVVDWLPFSQLLT
jgi:molybdopterin molybdotransferase